MLFPVFSLVQSSENDIATLVHQHMPSGMSSQKIGPAVPDDHHVTGHLLGPNDEISSDKIADWPSHKHRPFPLLLVDVDLMSLPLYS